MPHAATSRYGRFRRCRCPRIRARRPRPQIPGADGVRLGVLGQPGDDSQASPAFAVPPALTGRVLDCPGGGRYPQCRALEVVIHRETASVCVPAAAGGP